MQEAERFATFMAQLKPTNNTLDFFCDFHKIKRNVDEVAIDLNQLNYLLGRDDLDAAVRTLWERNPQAFRVMEILIAVRASEKRNVILLDGTLKPINQYLTSPEGVLEFLHGSGLDRVFQDRQVRNLVDYVFGIETGLDTNARKNRSGKLMERHVMAVFEENHLPVRREVESMEFPDLAVLGVDLKRFDFVIPTTRCNYMIEVNYYNSGGSKLNEVARSYIEIATKVNRLRGFEFVWITDGQGWNVAKGKLEEAFHAIPRVYNLTTLSNFVQEITQEL